MAINDVRPALPLDEHQALEDDHQRAHIQPLADELGRELKGRIGHDGVGLWKAKLHQEVDGVRAIWASIIDQILCDDLMPGLAEHLDDGSRPTTWLQNTTRQRLTPQ